MAPPTTHSPPRGPLVRGIDHNVSLPVFEGPMDLLLFLIRKNEIDIYDIPIGRITSQYLAILKSMETRQLEVAGEFFVMAATLMQIKSRLLLPRDEQLPGEEEETEEADPRWELVRQLIEYRKYKEAAGRLGEFMEQARDTLFRDYRPGPGETEERPLQPSDPMALWNVFNQVLRRLSEKIVVGQIHDETVTVAERMEAIVEELQRRPRFRFSELIQPGTSLPHLIATFLALLELSRLNRLSLQQDEAFGDIECAALRE